MSSLDRKREKERDIRLILSAQKLLFEMPRGDCKSFFCSRMVMWLLFLSFLSCFGFVFYINYLDIDWYNSQMIMNIWCEDYTNGFLLFSLISQSNKFFFLRELCYFFYVTFFMLRNLIACACVFRFVFMSVVGRSCDSCGLNIIL